MPHQLTVRYDDDVEVAITREAQTDGISKNRAALRLIRKGAGLEPGTPKTGKIGNSLDEFFGTWSEEQHQEFKQATKIFEEIDEEASAMRLGLDANAYSDFRRGHVAVGELLRQADSVELSTVALGEILAGFRGGTRYDENLESLRSFLAKPDVAVLDVGWTTADRFGRIMAALGRKGRPIPTNDVWIAAHAMETGAYLVSSDQHFEEVDGLAWIDPSA